MSAAAAPSEAIILAGGKAERLGDAAQGKPKPLVPVAGKPLIEYQIALLESVGVRRVIIACAAGTGEVFERELAGCALEVIPVEEREPLGRGGGIKHAAAVRKSDGPIFALNGDEILDVDLEALLDEHRGAGAAATITVFPLVSPFGIVEMAEDGFVSGFTEESPRLPHWVNVGLYVLEPEAIARFPEQGDHERETFPALAAEHKLYGYRHEGRWLTVNTPKQLRAAEEYLASAGWPALA